jgi:hypothetical protein
MTFATESAKPNSERFTLVKMTPARYVSADMSADGGGVYSIDWTYQINRVERNGTALTETSSTPGTNDYWYWSGTSLEVKLAAAPSATNVIVVFYDLFYTSGQYRITTIDPEDSGTDEVHWEPRLTQAPKVKQSVSGMLNGVLSSAITAVKLVNTDREFQNYLTSKDSFYEKVVKCWVCVNGVENIQKMFEGRIKRIDISGDEITFTLYDIFSLLDQPCLMGDSANEAYFLKESGSFPNVAASNAGNPVPYIAAPLSRYKTVDASDMIEIPSTYKYIDWSDADGTLSATVSEGFYSPEDLATAVETAMNAVATTNNYSVTYFASNRIFLFEEDSTNSFTLLWNTGANNGVNIAPKMGFAVIDDTAAFLSINGVGYTGVDSDYAIPFPVSRLDTSSLTSAVCTEASGFAGKDANRVWSVARFNSDGPRELNFDIQVGTDTKTATAMRIQSDANLVIQNLHLVKFTGADNNIRIGDSFAWENSAQTKSANALCVRDQSFTYGVQTYTHAFVVIDQSTKNGYEFLTLNSGDTWSTNTAPAVVLVERSSGKAWPLYYGRHFTTSETTLDSGNVYQYITLLDDVEDDLAYFHVDSDYLLRDLPIPEASSYSADVLTSYRPANAINPSDYDLYVRTGSDANVGHAHVAKALADKAGLTTNAASFTSAQSALDLNTAFSIPQFDEGDFASYRKYLELVCKSVMGLVFANNSFELEYQLLSAPSSTAAVDENTYRGLSIDVGYQDIVTQLIAYNPHNASEAALAGASSPSETVSSEVARHLHGVQVTRRFRHVLETITDRIQDIFDILSHRLAVYRFTTSSDHLASQIGDDLQLDASEVLGGSGSVDLKIIGLDKSADSVDIEASDLLDI